MLIFLKLGGSLITDKDKPYTARMDSIKRAAEETNKALQEDKNLKIVLGHGSGSFGHFAAKETGFTEGIRTADQWHGFQKVWHAAHDLNHQFMEEFTKVGLAVVSFPPSSSITSDNRIVCNWNIDPIKSALKNHLIPVVFGDTIFDQSLGGIILSTEELFLNLIQPLHPNRILLAGIEPGIWADFPEKKQLIPKITPDIFNRVNEQITTSISVDVTGGMHKKVALMLKALTVNPKLDIEIFSGSKPGNIYKSLKGMTTGTIIAAR